VTEAFFDDQLSPAEPLRVGVTIENRGVAPFYYPWQVVIAVADARGNVVKTSSVPWDITKVQPKQIRAFPDWGLSGKPRYVPFGKPQHFEFKMSGHGLGAGKYTLLMRVVHPLEYKKRAQPPHPLRFANQSQTPNGWLELGQFSVGP
jgi:hypothetical protein